jgi:MFS family permease
VAILLTLRLPVRAGTEHQKEFDGLGLCLLAGFVVPLLLALEQVQRIDPASYGRTVVLTAISIASLVLLIVQEKRARSPLLPIELLRQANVWRSDALAAFHGAALVSLTTFIPIYLRVTFGTSPSESGLLLLPLTIGIGCGSILTGQLVARTGRTAIFPSIGLMAVTVSLGCVAVWAHHLNTLHLAGILGVTAAFMGTTMAIVQVTVQNAAGPSMLGVAAASVQLSRSIGATLGTALVGAVIFVALGMINESALQVFEKIMRQGPEALAELPLPEQVLLRTAFSDAFSIAFLVIAIFTGAGALLAWSIPARRI